MSTGGALSAGSLAAIADELGTSVAMRWLDMIAPDTDHDNSGASYALKVVEDPTNKFVRLIKDPFNLISVVGPARSGKSTLMNLLAGCKKTELFATFSGMETFTKGIYIPTRVLSLPDFSQLEGDAPIAAANSNVKVSFVDSEGQGAVGTEYDMNLFSPALITSRVVIHNRTGGLLTEEILTQLGMMTQAAQRLHVDSADAPSKPRGPIFGHLFIIFNQYRLNATDNADTLLRKLMTVETSTAAPAKNRNNIRKLLLSVFESIQVFILPDKLKDEARDALSNGTKPFLLLEDFQPIYLEYFKKLRFALSQALVNPRELSAGHPLTGGSIADFMPAFADAINKAEPLNLPNIFEASMNSAIQNAQNTFIMGVRLLVEGFIKENAKPTQMLTVLFDKDVTMLLAQLGTTISYMSPEVVKKAQDAALASSSSSKDTLLIANLSRLQALISTALKEAIGSIDAEAQTVLPADKLLVSAPEVDNQFQALSTRLLGAFRAKGNTYDSMSFPAGYETTFSDALASKKTTILSLVANAWASWSLEVSQQQLQVFTDAIIALGKSTPADSSRTYVAQADALLLTAKRNFSSKLVAEYQGMVKDTVEKTFATSADSIKVTQQAIYEQNYAEVEANLFKLLERIKVLYNMQLQDAIQPNVEPLTYNEIVDPSRIKPQLTDFCVKNNISAALSDDIAFKFDTYVSSQKASFNTTFTKAQTDFSAYVTAELGRQIPLILGAFTADVDAIALDFTSSATTRALVAQQAAAKGTEARNKFSLLQITLNVKPNGVVSRSIIATASSQLEMGIKIGVQGKISKYDEVLAIFNKVLLTGLLLPVIDTALANKYTNVTSLNTDVKNARATFFAQCGGLVKDDPTCDPAKRWADFENTIYRGLVETVNRFNAYIVPGLSDNLAATKEIQIYVVDKIWRDCANIGNCFIMSYIAQYLFEGQKPQELPSGKDENGKTSTSPNKRAWRMQNQFKDQNAYDWTHSTNLEFFDWTVEISDIIWGKPIITDLKPEKINTMEYPASSTPTTVTVGTTDTLTTTITDSSTWGVEVGLEVTQSFGVKDIASTAIKANFKATFGGAHSDQATTTFTTTTSAQIVLPPNRVNVVNQLVFAQRTSLPYTARVKVIPRLRFTNGYTAWGGGGWYDTNPRTGALKRAFKGDGERKYDVQNFKRVDEIRDDARSNADPWEWALVLQRNPWLQQSLDNLANSAGYEVYVKGRWEGITGKYAVTTITPKVTSLTMLPSDA